MNNADINAFTSWDLMNWGLGCIVLTLAVVVSYLIGVQTGRRQERSLMAKQRIQKNKVSIYYYEQTIRTLQEEMKWIEAEKSALLARSESIVQAEAALLDYRKKIEEMEQAIQILSCDNQELKGSISSMTVENSGIDVSLLLQSLKKDPVRTNLSKEEWEALLDMTDTFFNGWLTALKNKYAMTRHELEICCLIKWYFSRKEQLAIFNNTSDALTKSKSRLKKRLGLDEKTDLDQYIRLY